MRSERACWLVGSWKALPTANVRAAVQRRSLCRESKVLNKRDKGGGALTGSSFTRHRFGYGLFAESAPTAGPALHPLDHRGRLEHNDTIYAELGTTDTRRGEIRSGQSCNR